jgi:hypothetical protein
VCVHGIYQFARDLQYLNALQRNRHVLELNALQAKQMGE